MSTDPISLISLIISGISLLITFIVAFNTWWRSRASINVTQLDDASRSAFLKSFDGNSQSYSYTDYSLKPIFKSIILIELIITNDSSLPLSVLEFSIPDFPDFNSYIEPPSLLTVTTGENSSIVFGNIESPVKYLQPEFTLEAYSSKRGYIFFWSGMERELDIENKIELTIKTSRKDFVKQVKVTGQHESIKQREKTSHYIK